MLVCTVVEWVPHSQVACGDSSIGTRLLSQTNRALNIARVKVKVGRSDNKTLRAEPDPLRGTWTED